MWERERGNDEQMKRVDEKINNSTLLPEATKIILITYKCWKTRFENKISVPKQRNFRLKSATKNQKFLILVQYLDYKSN